MARKAKEFFTTKERLVLSALLIVNIVLMFTKWFGTDKLENGIAGTIVLENPLTILFILCFLWGVWYKFKFPVNKILIFIGILGIIFMELWYFSTWHLLGYYEYFDIVASVEFSFMEFYIGIGSSIVTLITSIIFIRN